MAFDFLQFVTAVATVGATASIVYTIMRNMRLDLKEDMKQLREEYTQRSNELSERIAQRAQELHDRVDRQENRIFQLAMGKSFKEIMIEEKQTEDKKLKTKEK